MVGESKVPDPKVNSKIPNPVGLKDEETIIAENKAEIAKLLEDAGAVPQDPDTMAIVLQNILDPENVDALTNLTLEEIHAVTKLHTFNKLAKNPLISAYERKFLNVKRSQYSPVKNEPVSVLAGLFTLLRITPR